MLIHRGQRRAWSCYKRSRPVASPWSRPTSWSHAVVASNALDAMEVLDRRGRVWCHGRIKIHQYPTWSTNNETRPENSPGEGERKKTWLRGSSFGCTTHTRVKPNKQSDLHYGVERWGFRVWGTGALRYSRWQGWRCLGPQVLLTRTGR